MRGAGVKHLVITVHGIRTFGGWQERLECLLTEKSADRELTFISYKFGYFSVFAFIVPFFRWLIVRRFRIYFLAVVKSNAWDRIDLVGHSFGTHIIAWALYGIRAKDRPQINTIILAGSVLKSNFPWQVLIGHGVQRVVNDCGIKDAVLILNQATVLFTGMAGILGFYGGTGRSLRNRFFEYGHSGYFLTKGQPDDSFMRQYWMPLLTTDAPPESVDLRKAGVLSGVKLTLLNNAEPIKLAIYMTPVVGLALLFLSLYFQADRERKNAIAQRDRAQHALDRDRASIGIGVDGGWGTSDDGQGFPNKCYYYGDGSYLLSVSTEYLDRYKSRGFSLNSLCMALVSGIIFDPESGKRLPTYLKVDLKKYDEDKGEPGAATDELPLEVPDCFRRGLPYSDCSMNYKFFTGKPLTVEERSGYRELGRAIEQLMRSAISQGVACSQFRRGRDNCTLERWGDRKDEDNSLVKEYLAPEGYSLDLSERLVNRNARISERLITLSGVSFYDISKSFPTGFGYALNADGAASGDMSDRTREMLDQLGRTKKQ